MSYNRFTRPIILLILVIFFFFVPSFFPQRDKTNQDVCGIEEISCSTIPNELDGIQLDLGKILANIKSAIGISIKSFDSSYYTNELGFHITRLTSEEYKQSLLSKWEKYFTSTSSSSSEAGVEDVLSYLSFIPRPKSMIPTNIYTTSMEETDKLPDQFQSWTKENSDWMTRFVDDQGIDEWLEDLLPSTEVVKHMKWLKDGGKWGVVRSDLFRYLVLLLNGGVYTDTDTACVRPISEWGKNAIKHNSINPLIEALPQLISLSNQNHLYNIDSPIEDDSPSLIVALEIDSPASGSDWRSETFVRGIQIVQWTIAAKKGHPVFLDVIGHALDKVQELREVEEKGWENDDLQDILEWSGPGAFTDAVFRYLLVRYGFHPNQVSGLNRPLRVGDVLIMPEQSFRADASEGYQGDDKVVWHGFFGRWKSDKN
ncbi:uncharacterized protein IL334_004826 [Kwoniella shivajii]|uniref:Alpha 1,6-mannosyltransferase n=1 Tax=Kwoniella shivajii TaxID=564305 RepID=A0ABZ1D1F4_9TREE|nr:hypothetical protein IL334_004826 [Kwoniella shivajii]